MPLVRSTLLDQVRRIFDQQYPQFEGFPETQALAAERWGTALDAYAGTKVVPTPTLQAANSAKTAFQNVLATIGPSSDGITLVQTAFTAYAAQLALGMTGWVGIPPAVPINLVAVYDIGYGGGTSQAVADALATAVDAWFRTGLATQGPTTIPWS